MNYIIPQRLLVVLLSFSAATIFGMETPTSAKKFAPSLSKDSSKTTISTMSYEELKKAKNNLVSSGYKDKAVKYLQKMLTLAPAEQIADLMIELADLYFELGKLKKSELLYQEFCNLYPGSKFAEYATYRTILCGFHSILDVDRDQTITKETVTRAEKFLSRSAVFKEYHNDVAKILHACQEQLFNSELKIARFYASQGKLTSAQSRVGFIEKEFEGKIANLKPRLLIAECDWLYWNGDIKTFQEKRTELTQHFPDFKQESRSIRLAKNKQLVTQRDYVATF